MNRNIRVFSVTAFFICSLALPAHADGIQFGALLQSWGINDTTTATTQFNMRIRRAELKLTGSVAEGSRWFLSMDAAKNLSTGAISSSNDNKILQDFGVAFSFSKAVEIVLGQFKTPTTAESLDSSAELFFPERSLVARGISADKAWGDRREPGLMLTYRESIWKIWVAMTNGQRPNVDDVNSKKDLHIRLEATPIEGMKFGGFTTAGDYSYAQRAHWGLNTRFIHEDLQIRIDAVHAEDQGVKTNGWNVDAAYSLSSLFQPVVRYELLRNEVSEGAATSLGINYFYAKHGAKIQAAYSYLSDMSGANGTYQLSHGNHGSLITIAFQAAI